MMGFGKKEKTINRVSLNLPSRRTPKHVLILKIANQVIKNPIKDVCSQINFVFTNDRKPCPAVLSNIKAERLFVGEQCK